MNIQDIKNAKTIVDALRIDGGSYLYEMCYYDFLSITFGDETNIFNLQDGNIYHHSDLVTTIDDVPSIIQKMCINAPWTHPRLYDMVNVFLEVAPFLFDSRGFLVLKRSILGGIMTLGFDVPDEQHRLWDSIGDPVSKLYEIVRNLDAHIRSKESAIVHDTINNF